MGILITGQVLYRILTIVAGKLTASESDIVIVFEALKNPIITINRENTLLENLNSHFFDGSPDKLGLWGLIKVAQKKYSRLNLSSQSYAAPMLINRAERFAKKGEIERALSTFFEAQELSPGLKIAASSWNVLCWNGSLWQRAADVLKSCELAVDLEPDNGNIRNSHGLARALTGNKTGAIKDFQAYLKWGEEKGLSKEELTKRRQWIKQLQEDKNPFTSATLQLLRN